MLLAKPKNAGNAQRYQHHTADKSLLSFGNCCHFDDLSQRKVFGDGLAGSPIIVVRQHMEDSIVVLGLIAWSGTEGNELMPTQPSMRRGSKSSVR